MKKHDQELTLGSKVGLLQESGHTPGRHRTAGCSHGTNPLRGRGCTRGGALGGCRHDPVNGLGGRGPRPVSRIEGGPTPTSRGSTPGSESPISPVGRPMIEDVTIRNFSADTQRNYIRAVKNLAIFLG